LAAGYRQCRYANLSASFAKGFFAVSVFRFELKINLLFFGVLVFVVSFL